MLILLPFDVRVIHELCIKSYGFERTFRDVDPPLKSVYPTDDVVSRALYAWRKPSFFSGRIVFPAAFEFTAAVSCFPGTPVPAGAAFRIHRLFDCFAAVSYLDIHHHLVCFVTDDADSGMRSARINLDPVRPDILKFTCVRVFQDRDTRELPVDNRAPVFTETTEMCFRYETGRPFVSVK